MPISNHSPSLFIALMIIIAIIVLTLILVQFVLPDQAFVLGSKDERVPKYITHMELVDLISDSRSVQIHFLGQKFVADFDMRKPENKTNSVRFADNKIEFCSSEGDYTIPLQNIQMLEVISEDSNVKLIPTGETDPDKRLAHAE